MTVPQWFGSAVLAIVAVYILARVVSSAVCRSYFEQKKKAFHDIMTGKGE